MHNTTAYTVEKEFQNQFCSSQNHIVTLSKVRVGPLRMLLKEISSVWDLMLTLFYKCVKFIYNRNGIIFFRICHLSKSKRTNHFSF